MRIRTALLLLVCLCSYARAPAHTLSEELVLVDTDAGLDDLRAIALLARLPGIEVMGIVTGDGSAASDTGAVLVRVWLRRLGREDIHVFAGERSSRTPPPWRMLSDALYASLPDNERGKTPPLDWRRELANRIAAEPGRITVLALGPLTNLAELLKADPALARRLSRVVWYGSPPEGPASFNRDFDPEAARAIFASGVPVIPIASGRTRAEEPVFDKILLEAMAQGAAERGQALRWLFSVPAARERLEAGHYRVWDEAAVLYLIRPESFAQTDGVWTPEPAWLRSALVHFFRGPAGIPPARDNESFDRFPMGPDGFRADLAAHTNEIVSRHGPDEFRACVLVSELHQHLGIYSILGVKMSLRAREILAEPDHPLRVVSFAGSSPPLSCLNDGLQVGAGATLGLGMIRVEEKSPPRPAATFWADTKSVTLAVRPEVVERIAKEIAALKTQHGAFDAGYYRELRALAIRLWRELDRRLIFSEEPPARP